MYLISKIFTKNVNPISQLFVYLGKLKHFEQHKCLLNLVHILNINLNDSRIFDMQFFCLNEHLKQVNSLVI